LGRAQALSDAGASGKAGAHQEGQALMEIGSMEAWVCVNDLQTCAARAHSPGVLALHGLMLACIAWERERSICSFLMPPEQLA